MRNAGSPLLTAKRFSHMLRLSMRWEDTRVTILIDNPACLDAEKYLFALKEILTTEQQNEFLL